MTQRSPTDHPKTTRSHIPQKILYAAFQMQYHKLSEPQRNETTQINYEMIQMRMHVADQSSFTTKCVPLFQQKNANNDNVKNNENNGL